jgi:hypothetical protein
MSESSYRKAVEQQVSDARLAANRANAQHSTGPTTPEGKAKSSHNAVKTGLTGRTIRPLSPNLLNRPPLTLRRRQKQHKLLQHHGKVVYAGSG